MSYHAMAAWWQDDWWSTDQVQSGSKHPYVFDFEMVPDLQAIVSILSTGPVGPSDKIGMANLTRIMRTCATDGKLLKPSVPATAVDTTFAQRAFGAHGPQGELWSTYTQVGRLIYASAGAAGGPYTHHIFDCVVTYTRTRVHRCPVSSVVLCWPLCWTRHTR